MISIKDLAAITGYSVATISRVINNSPKVSEKTRNQVMEAIQSTGYHPNFVGRNLRLSETKKLLFLVPTTENTFYGDILRGAEACACEAGYQVIIGMTQNRVEIERRFIEMLQSRLVDGIVFANTNLDKHDINRIAETFPVVLMAHNIEGSKASNVSINNELATYEATSYLISNNQKRIAIISGFYYKNPSLDRERGYLQALEEAGISANKSYILRTDFDFKSGYQCCKKLMALESPPTAIFCIADSIAIGAMKYLYDIGKENEVAVIGFDNVPESEYFFNGLTTVNQPKYDIGYKSVELLLEKVSDINSESKEIILPHNIVVRGSTSFLSATKGAVSSD